ncbi:MAG: radical SAM protein [bacterium]|nr:radical SAM protein [bacterium]
MGLQHLPNLIAGRLRSLPILILYLTDGCNSRCVTCDIWRNPRRNMPMPLVEALVEQVKPLGIRWVVLSGGEAMQHPDWPSIAQKFRAQGAVVMLLTNGLLLRRQIDDVTGSVDQVVVSLDAGTPATYQAIRGVDGFDLILDGIRQVRAAGIPVTTRTTVQAANFREIPAIIQACKAVDVTQISFLTVDVSSTVAFGSRFNPDAALPIVQAVPAEHQPPISALTAHEIDELSAILDQVEIEYAADFSTGRIAESPVKLRRMIDYFGALNAAGAFPTVRCNAPQLSAVIEVDGGVRPCYFLPRTAKIRASLPLADALNTPEALDLRAAVRRGERSECVRCVCPLHKGAGALLKL